LKGDAAIQPVPVKRLFDRAAAVGPVPEPADIPAGGARAIYPVDSGGVRYPARQQCLCGSAFTRLNFQPGRAALLELVKNGSHAKSSGFCAKSGPIPARRSIRDLNRSEAVLDRGREPPLTVLFAPIGEALTGDAVATQWPCPTCGSDSLPSTITDSFCPSDQDRRSRGCR